MRMAAMSSPRTPCRYRWVPERRSFDYVRHGTIDLFAALNIATGKVIGKLSAQHRAVDFRDFLDQIDQIIDRICRYCSRISRPGH